MRIGPVLVAVVLHLAPSAAECRNACSGHGFCNTFDVCACQQGFTGGDCSQMLCPQGKAWGVITGTNVAHGVTECSGRGICDRLTGTCSCQLGFEGNACQLLACVDDCSNRGQCITMQQLAATPLVALDLYNQAPYQYSPYVMWDADIVRGCLCDAGSTGADCSLKQCHLGDDPMTSGQTEDVQLITCAASYLQHQVTLRYDAVISRGTFVLNFGRERTDPINYNAAATNALGTSMTEMLEALTTIATVTVTVSSTPTSTTWNIVFPPGAVDQHIFRPTWRVVEVQQFFCAADSGYATLTYDTHVFPSIPFSASAADLETLLESYVKIGAVTVTFSQGAQLCSPLGNYITVAFDLMRDRNYIGDLPALVIDRTNRNQLDGLKWAGGAPVVDAQTNELVKGIDTCHVAEVQSLTCCAVAGFFAVSFEGGTVRNLPFDMSASDLRSALLSAFPQLLDIDVDYSTGSSACSQAAPANVILIRFAVVTTNGPLGNGGLSLLTTDITNAGVSGLAHSSLHLLQLSATATQVVRGARCVPLNAGFAAQPTAQIVSNVLQGGGSFTVSYRAATTLPIPASASAADVTAALLQLPTCAGVDVTFTSGEACSTPANVLRLNFTQNFGALSSLSAAPTAGSPVVLATFSGGAIEPTSGLASLIGTKESYECSGRGTCDDIVTGTCSCFTGYEASDGRGNPASTTMRRDDCGTVSGMISHCPGDLPCSGHGVCMGAPSFRCQCVNGWRNGDCSERQCPFGRSWFSYPSADNVAHNDLAECSNAGLCDRSTGICTCRPPFTGPACEQMACNDITGVCNNGGQCLTLHEAAPLATVNGVRAEFTYGVDPNEPLTWDARKIQTCVCDAWHTGYDCSLLDCPHGDDPNTYLDVNEVQYVSCSATGGSFALTFRDQTSPLIPWNANAQTVAAALNTVSSGVMVTLHGGNTVACSANGVMIGITYLLDYGALPCIRTDNSLLTHAGNGNGLPGTGTLAVACGGAAMGGLTSVVGTKENALCSNHGTCDFTTGACKCDAFFASSDGLGGPGTRGDCSYRKPFQ